MDNDKKPGFNDLKANSINIFESDDKKARTTSQSGVKALFNSLKDGNELDRSGTSNEGGEPKTLHEVKKISESGPIAKFNQTDDVGNGRSESSRLGAESVLSAFRRASDAGFDGDRRSSLVVAPNSRTTFLLPFLKHATMSFLCTSIPQQMS